jgi:uncharacterized protein
VDNYITLVKFLMEPLLERRDALKIDCETNVKGDRILIRVAFDPNEKGRVFGRNGRTIQSIRTLLTTMGNKDDRTVRFDIFDPDPISEPTSGVSLGVSSSKPKPKPKAKLEEL